MAGPSSPRTTACRHNGNIRFWSRAMATKYSRCPAVRPRRRISWPRHVPSAPQVLGEALPVALSQNARWKNRLADNRAALRARYLDNGAAAELLRRHRQIIDNQLMTVWRHLEMPAALALVA